MKKIFRAKLFVLMILPTTLCCANVLPNGHGTWAKDTLYDNQGEIVGFEAGLFANAINNYNTMATASHKITTVFSYGGHMEMHCKGSGGSSPTKPCTEKTLQVYYDPGIQSTAAYYQAASETAYPVIISPVIEGQIGSDNLKTFNQLTESEASLFADKVAQVYCADEYVAGVQFNLEPFDLHQPGQVFFFNQLAKNLAGKHTASGNDPFHCVDATHKKGRFFSILTRSANLNAQVAALLNNYGNGYIIDPLFDLSSQPVGEATAPSKYYTYVTIEVANMMSKAKQFKVKYQLSIPAAASTHEFETMNGQKTGYHQIDYVKGAMKAIDQNGAKWDKNLIGINLFVWNHRLFCKCKSKEFTPASPNNWVLTYLANKL